MMMYIKRILSSLKIQNNKYITSQINTLKILVTIISSYRANIPQRMQDVFKHTYLFLELIMKQID